MPVLDLSKSKQTEIHLILLRQETIQKSGQKTLRKKRASTLAKKKNTKTFPVQSHPLLFSLHHSALPQNK